MALTLYGVNYFLDQVYGSGTPASVYVALLLASPTYLSTGSTITEPSGNGYARVEVTNDVTNWPDAADGFKANGQDITFPTATGTWGTVKYWAILDASTGGNILTWGGITSRRIGEGATVQFTRDQLSVTAR